MSSGGEVKDGKTVSTNASRKEVESVQTVGQASVIVSLDFKTVKCRRRILI